jgi:methanogenic corrinoid protein MtbC1
MPHSEIARGVQLFDADVVVLAATLAPHLKAVRRTIERIRALERREVKIIVGGPAFARVPDLWRRIGADGYSVKVEDTEPLGSRLTE